MAAGGGAGSTWRGTIGVVTKLAMNVVAVLVVLSTALGGCADSPPSVPPGDLVHIHRLGPAPDGGLYVATHTGLYRVTSDGGIEAIGTAAHDLMGFTVAGPDDLLASGHPDMRDTSLQVQGKPPLLGLVASSDGESWEPLSLLGEVDFHSLVAAHGNVYGLDSQTGALMVSDDRREWETRAERLAFTDIAVSPDEKDTLVGASPVGVQGSEDGGRSWTGLASQPLAYVAWVDDGFFGVSSDGQVLYSADGGKTWEERGGTDAAPHALLALDADVVFVAHERGIVRSDDGGRTFATVVDTTVGGSER